jgi:hypothetical protein
MRPVVFGEALRAATRLTLFSHEKPDRVFTVIKLSMDETSGVALALKNCVPTYQVEDEEGRTHLLIHLPIEANEHRWCLWRPDLAGFGESKLVYHMCIKAVLGESLVPVEMLRRTAGIIAL